MSSMNDSKQTGPLQNLFSDIKKILEFIEIKDLVEAQTYETIESRDAAEMWINAKLEEDTYITYKKYWTISMFQEVISNARLIDIKFFMENPHNVPLGFRDNLLKRGREAFLNQFEEKNEYYRMLNGLPPIDTPESEFIYLSEPVKNQLHASTDPVHLLSPLIQNNYMSTQEYKDVINNNPDKKYLKYLGMYKIDIFTARRAHDFDIIRYPLNRSDINPNLINTFSELYDNYREYVMTTLYNENLEGVYENYRTFMKMLIKSFVLLQISNKGLEAYHSRNFLDDSVIHVMLSTYDIPNTLLMTNDIRRKLVINMLKLVREKGTNNIYYDLVDILGYHDIIVSKLMLMKGQQFDKDNNYQTLLNDGNNINTLSSLNDDKISVNPYFVQVDLKDTDPYETITSGSAPIHDYHKIIKNDPTWWDLPDTQAILKDSNYTIADSKYVMIEAVIHQIQYIFESIYFTRMILDNKNYTDTFTVEIPEIFGTQSVSIYDLMVFIISATCMANGLTGEIVSEESKLLATAGFNFDLNLDLFNEYLNTTQYVDKERIMSFIKNLTMENSSDINRLFTDVMYPMREWLENKITDSNNRYEFLEYENIYRAFYTYDSSKNNFLDDFEIPMEIIRKKYNLSEDDMIAFKHFYPRTISGEAVTIDKFNASVNESRYRYPFLDRFNLVDWYMHIIIETPYGDDDRGYVYFHDILNSPDLRELTNPDGTRVFMDYEDGEIGWQINNQAVEKALEIISKLDEHALNKAYFQVNTPILNSGGKQYDVDDMLPASIRAGIYRDILKEKVLMDMEGLAVPPVTYQEYLYRRNEKLYNLLIEKDRFNLDKDAWFNDVMKIVLAVETELDLHMKYFEQAVVGSDLFFKPLITLINHFKSTYVNIIKTGIRYIFDDKIDTGGNSNMFKLFDEVRFIVSFVTLADSGFDSQFGLFDAEHKAKYHLIIKDRSEILKMTSTGFDAQTREECMGSIRMVDEMKFFKNGKPIDPDGQPSSWYSGEPGTGRWSMENDILMKARKETVRVTNLPVDLEGWKDFVESYNY